VIYMYSAEHQTRWNRGEFKVQLNLPGRTRPMGFCDGTEEDEEELRTMAESEEVEQLPIHKKLLKTGREIWTVGSAPSTEDWDEDGAL
jgi:hypothetical protein